MRPLLLSNLYVLTAWLIVSSWQLFSVSGYRDYVSKMPNTHQVCTNNAAGHQNCGGNGAARTSFGSDFANIGKLRWTMSLCLADSDGDGQSNGLELGDPCCVWTEGAVPAVATLISNPGESSSKTSRSCSAIACSNGVNPCLRTLTTVTPSIKPTTLPSPKPSLNPTANPSFAPSTAKPTFGPTPVTSGPTPAPTNAIPTFTESPSVEASVSPSAVPLFAPTEHPVASPTQYPVASPSEHPTDFPPSRRPSMDPTSANTLVVGALSETFDLCTRSLEDVDAFCWTTKDSSSGQIVRFGILNTFSSIDYFSLGFAKKMLYSEVIIIKNTGDFDNYYIGDYSASSITVSTSLQLANKAFAVDGDRVLVVFDMPVDTSRRLLNKGKDKDGEQAKEEDANEGGGVRSLLALGSFLLRRAFGLSSTNSINSKSNPQRRRLSSIDTTGSNNIIWAGGSLDSNGDFDYHIFRFQGTINLASGEISLLQNTKNGFLSFHAISMTVAWMILVPLAIYVARYGKYKPEPSSDSKAKITPDQASVEKNSGTCTGLLDYVRARQGMWFSIHSKAMGLATALVFGAFVVAVVKFAHVQDTHLKLGITVFALCMQQALFALVRPAAPTSSIPTPLIRTIWSEAHKWCGRFLLFAAFANVHSGISKLAPSIANDQAKSTYFGLYYAWVAILVGLFGYEEMKLRATTLSSDKDGKNDDKTVVDGDLEYTKVPSAPYKEIEMRKAGN